MTPDQKFDRKLVFGGSLRKAVELLYNHDGGLLGPDGHLLSNRIYVYRDQQARYLTPDKFEKLQQRMGLATSQRTEYHELLALNGSAYFDELLALQGFLSRQNFPLAEPPSQITTQSYRALTTWGTRVDQRWDTWHVCHQDGSLSTLVLKYHDKENPYSKSWAPKSLGVELHSSGPTPGTTYIEYCPTTGKPRFHLGLW